MTGPRDAATRKADTLRMWATPEVDPRRSDGYVFLVLRPLRVQARRESDEIAGRTLMRRGSWLV